MDDSALQALKSRPGITEEDDDAGNHDLEQGKSENNQTQKKNKNFIKIQDQHDN